MLKRFLFRSKFHVTEHCQWEYGAELEVAIISALGKSCSKTAHGITASSSSPHDEGLQKNQPNLPAQQTTHINILRRMQRLIS